MRSDSRILLMQAIFQMEAQDDDSSILLDRLLRNRDAEKNIAKDEGYIRKAFSFCKDNIEDIDRVINRYSRSWPANRMPKVDLALLRLAITEILYMDDIAPGVSANEAVVLAKKYGGEDSSRYINGILGQVIDNL